VNPALLALGVAVSLAAVVAVSARDARIATIGLVAVLAGGPLIAEPLQHPLAIAARVVAAVLAGFLIRVALRRDPLSIGSRVGWAAELVLGGAAFAIGLAAVGAFDPASSGVFEPAGPEAAVATGLTLVALAAAPLGDRLDGFRVGVGAALIVAGADLLRAGLAGPADGLGHLVLAGVVAGLGASIALLVVRTSQAIEGGLPAAGRLFRRP
jgi:hypothetical protein